MRMKPSSNNKDYVRIGERIYSVKDLSVNYEGRTENIANRPPDVSARGMFVNTSQRFPEGAVLNLRFRLALTGVEIRTRCEVRYWLPGVGVGVEFVGIAAEAVRAIESEVKLCTSRAASRSTRKARRKVSRVS
jgi:PilZ domain